MNDKSIFLKTYRNIMSDKIIRMHPKWNIKEVNEKIDNILENKLMNPEVIADNNYTKRRANTNLLAVLDWAMCKKPILAGNGTFYKQHAESENPNCSMVDGFLNDRKQYKKKMFSIENEDSPIYKAFDLLQQNTKKLANSYYGASGAKTSPFYSKWSAIATTSSAQSAISTTETTFEAFLVDNFVFIHFNECIDWLNSVLSNKIELDDWVKRVSIDKVYDRIINKILSVNESQKEFLMNYFKTLTEEELTIIYWKNNLIEFTNEHKKVKDIHNEIFSRIPNYEEMTDDKDIEKIPIEFRDEFLSKEKPMKEWNNFVSVEKFYNPNKIPDTISKYIEKLKDIYMKYIYVKFVHVDRVYRLKNFKRDTVTVIDTDSNILSLDTWMKFCKENLMIGNYGRSNDDNVFIAINTITYIIGVVVNDILLYYGECSNVDEKIRPRYNMKNEFYFSKLIIAKVKKRYLSKIIRREGSILTKPKYDVKGFDFKKATTSEAAEKVYMNLVKHDLLDSDEINLNELMNKLQDFKKEIERSIRSSEITFLPNANAKELEAYVDPGTNQGVRGVMAWNICEPDKMIEFPAKVTIVKMNITSLDVIKPLQEKNPELYERIKTKIFEDKTKIFIKWKKNSKGEMVEDCKGMNVLAIPTNQKIPDWALEYIDYRTIINNVLAPFKSVTEIFNLPGIEEGETGRKTTSISNIIRL